MNIILDLDETLVSVTNDPVAHDFKFSLQGPGGQLWYYVRERPYLQVFLKYIFSRFQTVSVWTAATKSYAHNVIRGIMTPEQISRLAIVYTRGDLKVARDGAYTKPLNKIFTMHPLIKRHNTLMIDDRRSVMLENLGNGIVVPAWKGETRDISLKQLIIALSGILKFKDHMGFDSYKEVIYLKDIVS